MSYNITDSLIEKLSRLAKGEMLPASECRGGIFSELKKEGLIIPISKGRGTICMVTNGIALRTYLASCDDAFKVLLEDSSKPSNPLDALLSKALFPNIVEASDQKTLPERAKQAAATGNSKIRKTRSCKGFLINCYEPISAKLNGKNFEINPPEGSFVFIADYENFEIPQNVIVVGIENMENFRYIRQQKKLFQNYLAEYFGDSNYTQAPLLFVSRYPQSSDLVKWLQNNKNLYIHFGDLDLAGINIYLTEFYAKIGDRATFLIPPDAETRIINGSRERYDDQILKFEKMKVADERVQPLVDLIKKYHKGYDQEGYIE